MLIAYVDESGNSGWKGSQTYVLGCVMVEADRWPRVFDGVLDFRRWVRDQFGVLLRDEIKANYLVRNKGPLKRCGLGDGMRRRIYTQHMRLHAKVGTEVFAVLIDKGNILKRTRDPREVAWEYLLQRLERFSDARNTPVQLVHDEGETAAVRKLARKARRAGSAGSAFGTGMLRRPFKMLIDDPVPRRSDHSFFVQLADLAAYAAYRRVYPPPSKVQSVCPQSTWDELGPALAADATALAQRRDPTVIPGLVVWPK